MASLKVRQGWDRTVYLVNIVLACITVIPLFLIIGKIVLEGYQQINWDFFTKTAPTAVEAMMAKRANTIEGSRTILPGGIANGIVGTLLMTLVASIIAIPIGLLGGIYLSENRSTRLAHVVRFVTDLLQGTPSIVIGIIVYAWVVLPMRGYSALAGAVALAIMMLPLIIRSTEETLARLPKSFKESALALGCSYRKMVLKILLPSAMGGLLTGILLAVSRIIGETAPLIMTALGSARISWTLDTPSSAVPLLIWEFYSDPNLQEMIWSSSLFLLLLVLLLNFIAKRISDRTRY